MPLARCQPRTVHVPDARHQPLASHLCCCRLPCRSLLPPQVLLEVWGEAESLEGLHSAVAQFCPETKARWGGPEQVGGLAGGVIRAAAGSRQLAAASAAGNAVHGYGLTCCALEPYCSFLQCRSLAPASLHPSNPRAPPSFPAFLPLKTVV